MNSKNQGLTVGELSIAIAILIVIGIIWSNFKKEKNDGELSLKLNPSNPELLREAFINNHKRI